MDNQRLRNVNSLPTAFSLTRGLLAGVAFWLALALPASAEIGPNRAPWPFSPGLPEVDGCVVMEGSKKYGPLLEAFQNLRGATQTMRLRVEPIDGKPLEIAVEELGPETDEHLIVLIHGIPADRRSFEPLAGLLGQKYRVLLVDLLGCGESDRPAPRRLAEDGYSRQAQARRLLEALKDHAEKTQRSPRLTLVGHSYGAFLILEILTNRNLQDDYGSVYSRVQDAVFISGGTFQVSAPGETQRKVARLTPVKAALATRSGLLAKRIYKAFEHSFDDSTRRDRPCAYPQRLIQVLSDRKTRQAARKMLRQVLPWDPDTETPDWPKVNELARRYSSITKPVLVIWGDRDEALPLELAFRLHWNLPQAWLWVLENSKHSLLFERPRALATLIHEFETARDTWKEKIQIVQPTDLQLPEALRPSSVGSERDTVLLARKQGEQPEAAISREVGQPTGP